MESGHRDCLLQQSQDLTSGFAAGSAPTLSRELQLSYFWFRLQALLANLASIIWVQQAGS